MKKDHSVFITISPDELIPILDREFSRRGWLKDIPKNAELEPWDDTQDICIEYKWSVKGE